MKEKKADERESLLETDARGSVTGNSTRDARKMLTHLAALQVTRSQEEKTHKYKEKWDFQPMVAGQ